MGNFDRRGKRSNGGSSRGFGSGRKFGGGRDRGRPEMHDAICSDCGDDCQVPFRPTGNKPVLCSDCFGGNDSRGGRDRGRDRDRGGRRERSRYEDKQMFDAVCSDCGDDCQVPFRPTGNKPVRCNDCFGGQDDRGGRSDRSGGGKKDKGSKEVVEQIKMLNTKIDKLLEILTPDAPVKEEKKPKAEKKEKPKTKKKTATKKASTKKKK